MKPSCQFAALIILLGIAFQVSAANTNNTNVLRCTGARISPSILHPGQSVRVTFFTESRLNKAHVFYTSLFECMSPNCAKIKHVKSMNFPLPASTSLIRKQHTYQFKPILSQTTNQLKIQIRCHTARQGSKIITASARVQSRNKSNDPISIAGSAAKTIPGQNQLQRAQQSGSRRISEDTFQKVLRERQEVNNTLTQTRGGQLMADLQVAIKNFMQAYSHLTNKRLQCIRRSYSASDDRQAGCRTTDTVAQCDQKRLNWCTRSEWTQFMAALSRLRRAKTQAVREINGLNSCTNLSSTQAYLTYRSNCLPNIRLIME